MRQHDKFGVVKIAPEISTSNNAHCWGSKLPPKSPIKAPIYTPKSGPYSNYYMHNSHILNCKCPKNGHHQSSLPL